MSIPISGRPFGGRTRCSMARKAVRYFMKTFPSRRPASLSRRFAPLSRRPARFAFAFSLSWGFASLLRLRYFIAGLCFAIAALLASLDRAAPRGFTRLTLTYTPNEQSALRSTLISLRTMRYSFNAVLSSIAIGLSVSCESCQCRQSRLGCG